VQVRRNKSIEITKSVAWFFTFSSLFHSNLFILTETRNFQMLWTEISGKNLFQRHSLEYMNIKLLHICEFLDLYTSDDRLVFRTRKPGRQWWFGYAAVPNLGQRKKAHGWWGKRSRNFPTFWATWLKSTFPKCLLPAKAIPTERRVTWISRRLEDNAGN